MSIGNILKESLGIARKHTIIIVPPVLVSFLIGCLSIVVIGMRMTAMEPDAVGELGQGVTDVIRVKSVRAVVG